MQVHVDNRHNPNPARIYLCLVQGVADHDEALASRERVFFVVAVLGTSDNNDQLLHFFKDSLDGFEVA